MYLRDDHCDGVVNAIVRFLQGTLSLKNLVLASQDGQSISEKALLFICSALANCASLKTLHFLGLLVKDPSIERISHGGLASAIANCSSLTAVFIRDIMNDTNNISINDVVLALSRSTAVRDFDLSVMLAANGNGLLFERPSWWKMTLPLNIPLNLWSYVLKNADSYIGSVTHSSLDILYLLVKEKCDVLLQNARKRRIRKRKRYALDG